MNNQNDAKDDTSFVMGDEKFEGVTSGVGVQIYESSAQNVRWMQK